MTSETMLHPSSTTISVKEAAQQLGISIWRIYRMNRTNGALKFIQKDRRIYVETSSLSLYVNELRHSRDAQAISVNDLQKTETPSATNLPETESLVAESGDRGDKASELTQYSGQRELRPRPRNNGVVIFISDWSPIG